MLTDEELSEVTPEALVAYLQRAGWVRSAIWRGADVYSNDAGGGFVYEVLICPAGMGDYTDRIRDALRAIGTHEQRTDREVYVRIRWPFADADQVAERLAADAARLMRITWGKRHHGRTVLAVGSMHRIADALSLAARREPLNPDGGACTSPDAARAAL